MPVMTAAEIHDFMSQTFPAGELPWSIDEVTDTGCVITCPANEWSARPGGTLSGPALMGYADGAAFVALVAQIGPETMAVTSNLNINFLRRPPLATTRVEANNLKIGRTLALIETTLFTVGDPKPVAHAVVTYSMALLGRSVA